MSCLLLGLAVNVARALPLPPANDYFTNALVITNVSGTVTGYNNTLATMETNEPTPVLCDDDGLVDVTNSVWYLWTAPTNGTVQFNTIGSDFDTVLAVYKGSVTTNGLADPSIAFVGADDDNGFNLGGDTNFTSSLSFSAVAGTTYFISVDGNADDLGDAFGNVVLNWKMNNVPNLTSGTFKFTSANYVVSERDSTALIEPGDGATFGDTPSETFIGARLTVTRTGPAVGRALVDYQFSTTNFINYTNYFYTNSFVTNITVTYISSNGVPSVTNDIITYYVFSNYFGYYDAGYKNYVIPGAYTNYTRTYTLNNAPVLANTVSTGGTYDGVVIPFPPAVTTFTNTVAGFTNLLGTPEEIFTTNIFSFVSATNGLVTGVTPGTGQTVADVFGNVYTNQEFDYTNEQLTVDFGTNISLAYIDPTSGDEDLTNIDVTNMIVENLNSTNAIYTNGIQATLYVGSTSNSVISGTFSSIENDYTNNPTFVVKDLGTHNTAIPPTNPPVGGLFNSISISYTPGTVSSGGDSTTYLTNLTTFAQTVTNQIVPSIDGINVNYAGTLTFDDYQMSQDILVPVNQTAGPDIPDLSGNSSVAQIILTNARLDSLESPLLNPPAIDSVQGVAVVNALSTTFPPGTALFNFEHSAFRVDKDVGGGNAIVSVVRTGDTSQSVTVQYRIDYNNNNTFTLQAGSDYATPGSDFTSVTGTLTFPAAPATGYDNQQITIPILNNGLVEFNEDMLLQLYNPNGAAPGALVGEVGTANLTILFDDATAGQQPAGAADRTWNQNNVNISNPPYISYPGTAGNGGTVYALAEQPDGNLIVAGSFNSFDQHPYNRIVRLLSNGYQDTTFLASPNSGANDFISALALQPDGTIIIGGNFTSFNGVNRHHIARLNSDGSLDTTFAPGLGANGTVWSVALETNVQVLIPGILSITNVQVVIGGAFTSVNGTLLNGVARLNSDGSVDATFNPGIGPDGVVNAVAVDPLGRIIIGGSFDKVSGVTSGGVARLNVDGSLDTTFSPGIGTYDSGTGATDPVYAVAVQPNGQILVGGAFSYLDLNSYNGIGRLNTDGTVDLTFTPGTGTLNPLTGFSDTVYNITLQTNSEILVGGDFTTFNQTRRVGVARLYTDGTVDTSFMDTAYNQFAGVPNHYFNASAVNPLLYPTTNDRNFVYAIAQEAGGNVIIGGGFSYVGGGSTRDDTRPRSNVARLIGGYTPGPGNMELAYGSYTADKDIGGNGLYVSLLRSSINSLNPGVTNNLGIVSVTFSTNTAAPGPGIAGGNNFTLSTAYTTPYWTTTWANIQWWTYDYGVYGPNYSTIPLNTGTAAVYVGITNDANITGNLNANFALSNPSSFPTANSPGFFLGGEQIPLGAALGTQSTAQFTIIDDNITPGVLGFSSPTFSVTDNGGTATITVTRSGGSDGVVQVTYATSNGTATNGPGLDYIGVTNTLTFGQGIVSNSFTVPVISQSSTAPDKTVNVRLYNATGGAALGVTNAVLTIINHNYTPGHLGFTSPTYSVSENSGVALVTVNRLGGSSGKMTVNVIIRNGSATNGVNYDIAPTNYPVSTNALSWNDGDATSRTISIPVLDDGVVTTNLTVFLQLANPVALNKFNANVLSLSQYTNATLFIDNVDSPGTVQFTSPVYSVKKYGGFALIPVMRVGGIAQTVTVNFATANGTALAGSNYYATNGTLTFTNGETGKFFAVPIIDNGTNDGLKFLTVSLSGAAPSGALGSITNAILNIIDTESVNETPGSPDVTYNTLGLNNTAYALALQPNNQLLVGGDFTFADGVPRQRIARLNSDGTLDSTFSQPSSAYGASASVRALAVQADGRILVGGLFTNFNSVAMNYFARLNPDGSLDSLFNPGSGADNPVYAIASTTNDAAAQTEIYIGGAFATIGGTPINSIARLNSDGTLDTAFNPGLGANAAVYAMAVQPDGKVVIGGDFTAVNGNTNMNHIARLNTDGSVDATFNPGAGANGSVRAITLQLNGEILIGGFFTAVNGSSLNYIARLNANGSVDASFHPGIGANNGVFSIALQTDSRIVVGGEFTTCNGVTRNAITRLNPDGTVDPTINFGAGANNFVAAIAVQEDVISGYPTNVPDEKIILGGGFTQYDSQTQNYLVRIYGGSIGGSGAFEFSSANYQADENSTNIVITVIRTGGTSGTNSDGSGDVFVPAYTSDGSAMAGTNYRAVTNNLDFPEGEVIRTITVSLIDDMVITTNLTVNLAVNPLPPAQFGNQPTAVLNIINDDSEVNFSSATYTVPKNAVNGAATINIVRLGSTFGTSIVNFSTVAGGSAQVGTDYYPVSQTVIFNPGVSNVAVTVPIVNNGVPEGNQTVDMSLTGPTGSLLYAPSNAVLTIIDTANAPGQLAFSSANYAVTEGGGAGYTNAIITVVRTNGSAGTVTVGFSTLDGTAVAGVKYVATNGILSFGEGETVKTFAVQVLNTATAEGTESLSVFLSNPTGGAALAVPATATLAILNTNIGIAFDATTYTATEPYGFGSSSALLNVLRLNGTNGITTVGYYTTNGTAVAGTNYVASAGTITFTNGQSLQTIAIPLIYDPLVTGNLTFMVGLSNNPVGGQLTSPSVATVVDQDANAGLSLVSSNLTVFKNSGNAIIAVVCSNTNVEPVSVQYSTAPGSAVAGTDFKTTSGTLMFTNGLVTNYFAVPIIPNNLVESNRSFTVSLSSPTAPGVLLPPSTAAVFIVETNSAYGLSFFSPVVLSGDWGATNIDNTGGAAEPGDPNIAGFAPNAPVWFQWTAPSDGEVELDTIGSYATNGTKLDTVLAVFTGNNLSGLNQVAANDDLYPQTFGNLSEMQENYTHQNIYNTNALNSTNLLLFTLPFENIEEYYFQPYGGPSGLRFNARAGTSYYFVADTKASFGYTFVPYPPYILYTTNGVGPISLNWAYHPSGVFRFATENIDETGLFSTNGNPLLLYQCAETETESASYIEGPFNANQFESTYHSYYDYDVPGMLVTVTRVAGSTGRVAVDYTTVDGNVNVLTNGDLPAVADVDYIPVTGTLVFDDYEMSKTIYVEILPHVAPFGELDTTGLSYEPNRDFTIALSNPRRDPSESADVSAPRVDPVYGQALCRILDCDIDPRGASQSRVVATNTIPGTTNTIVSTNIVYSLVPTNAIFNFSKANYRVPRDVQSAYWHGTPVTVYVNRTGTNLAAQTVFYRFDNYALDNTGDNSDNIYFPLQPGSDYATPTTPGDVRDTAVIDYNPTAADPGTLTFAAKKFISQPISFNVTDNNLTEFNKDIHIDIYAEDSDKNPYQVGMVDECDVTILFDDLSPPAGSVDELWNPDYGSDLAVPTATIGSSVGNPGTESTSEIYGLAVTTNNETIIGGAFVTYADGNNTYTVNGLARLKLDGSLDTTFSSGTGVNVVPGGEFIRSVALTVNNQVVIGGKFASYNGVQRNSIARLNSDGSLDTTFSPGAGANGTVWSVLPLSNGQVMIAGDFTTYNSIRCPYVARLNTDGSLDTTFNTGSLLSGPVYAMAAAPAFYFSASGGTNENDQVLNLGKITAGLLTVNYNFNTISNDMQVYYGNTNVAAGTGVLIYDTLTNNGVGNFVVPFGPTGGLTANRITIVMNQGGNPNFGAVWAYSGTVTVPPNTGAILIGGKFGVSGQIYANIARLNTDGTLDTSFNPGTGADNVVRSLAWQLNNQLLAGGDFTHINGSSQNHVVRLNQDGSLDSGFYSGTGTDNSVYSITPQLDGTIYVGGAFTSFNGTHRLGFTRLFADGTVDTSFMDTAYNQFAGLPRIRFIDPPGTVYASGVQSDGNVMIAGSFAQVGGGQFDVNVRPGDYGFDSSLGAYLNLNIWPEPKTRDGIRNRGNVARLIGGATPGPGNIGMAATSYAVNKTDSFESVSLVRTNGFLGYASANFSVLPGLAQSGSDYTYDATAPTYPIEWEFFGPSRMHSDGLYGAGGLMNDSVVAGAFWRFGLNGPAAVLVSIINDSLSSGNLNAQFQMANPSGADQFYLGGQNIPLGVALGESVAPLTVVDDAHQDGVFGFAASSFTATNSSAVLGVVRTNSTSGTVELNYQTTTNGSTAVLGTDYTAASGTLTFNPAQTSNSFSVSVLQNSSRSSVEKIVNLQLFNIQDLSSGNAAFGLTNTVLRIINPNFQGYLNFTTNYYTGSLSAGSIVVTVTRTVGSEGTLNVQYATSDGTAVNGTDYTGSTNTLTWNNGDVSPRSIIIPLINNHAVGGSSRQFSISLFNPMLNGSGAPSLLGAVTNATVIINNDNSYGTFQFSASAYRVNENGGYATATVTRTGSTNGSPSVSFTTADATAFAGTNYVATNGILFFAPGQISQSFNVRILDDGKTNPPPAGFFFNVALTNVSAGASLGSATNVPVQILDAESYTQPSGSPDAAFSSYAGFNDSVFALALQSDGQIVAGGNFTVANGSDVNRVARLNTDGTLDTGFMNGLAGADASVNAVVSQTDDRILIGGAFANIDNIIRHRVARLMTDGSLDTSFNTGSGADNTVFALAETFINGSREIYVGGAFSTINGVTSPGMARLNNDGSVDTSFATGLGASGTVYAVAAYPTNSIANAGQVLVGGAITNFNNVVVGNLVRLNVDGSVDTNFSANIGANNDIRAIAIQTDGSVLVGGDFTSVNGTAVNRIARLNPDGSLDTNFVSAVGLGANGTVEAITIQSDNRIVLAGDFTQANGVTRNSITRLLPTGAVDPTINFGDGANSDIDALAIQPADGMIVIGGGFTQYDDQTHEHIARLYGGSITGSGAFEFTSAGYQVDENGAYAVVNVRRDGGTSGTNADGSGDVLVNFATSNGTAVNGVNYTSISTNLDFPTGEVLRTILVPVMDDQVITPNLTVNLTLSNPTPPAVLGNQSTAVLTIINDDSAVNFLSSIYSVPKNTVNGVATIDIVRQGTASGTCTVDFSTTTNGTAVIGTDYYPTNAVVTFNPGDTDKTVQIPIINNTIPEGSTTVTMQLTNAAGTALYSPSNATLTIIDTVYAPGLLAFSTNSYVASEGGTNAYLTVVRTGGSSGAVSVNYQTVSGTALPGVSYITSSGTVPFVAGQTSNTIVVPLVQNSLVLGTVDFSVYLSNPGGGAALATPTTANVSILDDNVGVAFVNGTNYVSETNSPGLVFVQRIGNPTNVFQVNYATANGSALAGINYQATSGTLSFTNGEVLKAVSVPLYNANGVTNVTFNMSLTNATAGVQLVSPSNALVVIRPANAGLSFTNAAMSVFKNSGAAVITVVCSNPALEPVNTNAAPLSVNYYTSDGSALAGQDYTNTSGTLLFTNGIGTNTFSVPIVNNNLVTGSRTFTVSLTNASAPGKIIFPSNQVVTIIDNNSGLSFSSPTYAVLKTGVAATITVLRTDDTNQTTSVNFTTLNGTALAGTDYIATNGTFVFTNGQTSQSFQVTVIANTAVQPDKTVLLQLSSPTNGTLVAPSAATLTIHDTSGSLVVPDGSVLTHEGFSPPNGIIDPGENVTLLFAFRAEAGTNIPSFTATLLATNGVTSPANVGAMNPGSLIVGGRPASQAWNFTASGTNGQQIAATFNLFNGAASIGTAVFTYTLGTVSTTYYNSNAIIINADTTALPYPSIINVSDVGGQVIKATVTLTNLYHTAVSSVDALVVAPDQQDTLIMGDAGGPNAVGPITLTFDDAATNSLPQFTPIVSGTNKPTAFPPVPNFP